MADDIGPFAGLPAIFTGAFGEPVAYRPAAGGTLAISGIFIDPYRLVDFGDAAGIEGSAPELHVRGEDVPAAAQGDSLTVRGAAYEVIGVEPDRKGMVRLRLHEE